MNDEIKATIALMVTTNDVDIRDELRTHLAQLLKMKRDALIVTHTVELKKWNDLEIEAMDQHVSKDWSHNLELVTNNDLHSCNWFTRDATPEMEDFLSKRGVNFSSGHSGNPDNEAFYIYNQTENCAVTYYGDTPAGCVEIKRIGQALYFAK